MYILKHNKITISSYLYNQNSMGGTWKPFKMHMSIHRDERLFKSIKCDTLIRSLIITVHLSGKSKVIYNKSQAAL